MMTEIDQLRYQVNVLSEMVVQSLEILARSSSTYDCDLLFKINNQYCELINNIGEVDEKD